MNNNRWLEFEFAPAMLGFPVSVRLRDHQARWLAIIRCQGASTQGLGGSARDALVAALTPLGTRVAAALMADTAMFGASASILAARAG